MGRLLVGMVVLVGCYHPNAPFGAPCGKDDACPYGQECRGGLCLEPGGGGDDGGDDGDGPVGNDGPDAFLIDAPSTCSQWQAKHFNPCSIPAPTSDVMLMTAGAYIYDTDAGTLTTPNGGAVAHTSTVITQLGTPTTMARLASLSGLAVGANVTLRVRGSLPLIIASWGTIQVTGTVDAGSATGVIGANSNPASCTATAATPGQIGVASGGSGGGAGGGFGGKGGNGGQGDSPPGPLGGTGGTAVPTPKVVRGGCSGSRGGGSGPAAMLPSVPTTFAAGGAGGGAIELAARTQIAISGRVLAGGAGGDGTAMGADCGGGGGGSGGYIGLDAPSITNAGILAANGGGGGTSAPYANVGNPGNPGQPGALPASGGASPAACAPPGAAGGASLLVDGAPAIGNGGCGGGAGGGAVGYVLVFSSGYSTNGATVSPTAMLNP